MIELEKKNDSVFSLYGKRGGVLRVGGSFEGRERGYLPDSGKGGLGRMIVGEDFSKKIGRIP